VRLKLEPGADISALVRGGDAESLVVLVSPALDSLAMALARAAIAPLAIEIAPARRLNAVFPADGAKPDDIEAACAFLERAPSTTGQLLDIA
jgi:hypothetical protein